MPASLRGATADQQREPDVSLLTEAGIGSGGRRESCDQHAISRERSDWKRTMRLPASTQRQNERTVRAPSLRESRQDLGCPRTL